MPTPNAPAPWCCATPPCRLPHNELKQRFAAAGDWDAALQQGVGNWSTATIDMRLDTRIAPLGLKEWYISEMDRTSPTVARKLQAYLDTLDFRHHLQEITVPTLLLVGADTPTSPLAQQEFMAQEIPTCHLAVHPDVGHGINVLRPQWCVQQVMDRRSSATRQGWSTGIGGCDATMKRRVSSSECRSSRQGCTPAGVSPAMPVARVGHGAMPLLGAGNQPGSARCKRPGRPGGMTSCGGSSRGA
jgi:hypothetical protein